MGEQRTTLSLDSGDHQLLKEVAEENGWTVGEGTRRAIHALFALDAQLKAMAEDQGGEIGSLIERVRLDVDPGLVVRPNLRHADLDEGVGVGANDVVFFERDDALLAQREIGGSVELYEVRKDGRLALKHEAPVPALD